MLSDEELLTSTLHGDPSAFGELFDRHAGAIHAYAQRRVHHAGLADDIVAQTFTDAWRMRARVAALDGELRPWLYGVARNHVRHHWRSERRRGAAFERVSQLAAAQSSDHAQTVADDEAVRTRLTRTLAAIESLDDIGRELLTLAVWEELSYREIAAAMNMPIGTVRSKLSRARSELARLVGGSS